MIKKIEGLIAAAFAAYNPDGSINLALIPTIVDQLVEQGMKGVFVCGTNGEGPSLSVEERMQIAEAYKKAAEGRLLVFIHVGHSAINEARRLAAHAQQIGADYISAVSAFYFKPSSVQILVESMAEIASAAPDTPFYYYHIPHVTGLQIDMLEFLSLAEEAIPNFAGVKYTASTIHEYQTCLHYKDGKFDILFGYDELLLPALAVGAKGAIGSTYNYAGKLYNQVIAHVAENKWEEAEKLHFEAVRMVGLLVKYGSIPTQRALMKVAGLDLGEPRLPLRSLSVESSSKLDQDLEKSQFMQLVARL